MKRYANFPQAPQEEASLTNRYVKGSLSLLPQVDQYRDELTRKKAGFPCSILNDGTSSSHIMKGLLNPCGDPGESPRSPALLDWRPHITWTPRGAREFNDSKGDNP